MTTRQSLPPDDGREPRVDEVERSLWVRALIGPAAHLGPTDSLAQRMREVYFAKGQTLYRRGAASERMFFIVRGQVKLVRERSAARVFGPRDVLGVVDTLQERPHAFDAVATEDVLALELDYDDWLEFLEDNFEFTRAILTRLAASLPPVSRFGSSFESLLGETQSGTRRIPSSLSFVERLAVIRSCPLFWRGSIQALARLARFAEIELLEEGAIVHVASRGLCLVESGRVRATITAGTEAAYREELEAGGAVGGFRLLDPTDLSVEVEALTPSSLLHIDTEILFDVMEDHFSLGLSLFAYLAREGESQALQLAQAQDDERRSRGS